MKQVFYSALLSKSSNYFLLLLIAYIQNIDSEHFLEILNMEPSALYDATHPLYDEFRFIKR